MAIPADVLTSLNEGLAAVATIGALAFLIVIGISAMKYMRKAVGGDGGDYYSGYTVADDVHDRALTYNAQRDFSEISSDTQWKEDRAQAARDVTKQQKYF